MKKVFLILICIIICTAMPSPTNASSQFDPVMDRINSLLETDYGLFDPITREQFCVAVAILFNDGRVSNAVPYFADLHDIKTENIGYLSALVEDGLLVGATIDDRFYMLPNATITRQEAFTFLGRVLGETSDSRLAFDDADDIALFAYSYMAWFIDWGIIVGYGDGTVRPRAVINAGEFAIMAAKTIDHLAMVQNNIVTLAGTGGRGYIDGANARFTLPHSLIVDSDGQITVFDTYNNVIRTISQGRTNTLTGKIEYFDDTGFPMGFYVDDALDKALLNRPADGVRSSNGELYFADSANNVIRFIRDGEVYTFSGMGTAGHTNDARNTARFNSPMAIAIDRNDNIYVADTLNNVIRRVDSRGNVTTVAGVPGNNGYRNGASGEALFNEPSGIAVSADGRTIYVADTGNHVIRKIENGQVTTVAGVVEQYDDGVPLGGFRNGFASVAMFELPKGLALYNGVLYIADSGNHMIRSLTTDGYVFTVVGNGEPGDTDISSMGAVLNSPVGITVRNGFLYIADTGNNKIKSIRLIQ
jgi:sugar lactone lactonase YvrE